MELPRLFHQSLTLVCLVWFVGLADALWVMLLDFLLLFYSLLLLLCFGTFLQREGHLLKKVKLTKSKSRLVCMGAVTQTIYLAL